MLRLAKVTRSLKFKSLHHDVGSFSISSSSTVRIGSNPKIEKIIEKNCRIWRDFVTQHEEKAILTEINPILCRVPYEESHWDRAINHYREIERRDWTDPLVPEILQRIRRAAFRPDDDLMGPTHCLDVAEYGAILPHIDSVKFVGRALASLSLLSDSIIRFRVKDQPEEYVDCILPRYSLYCMEDAARYDFTHEILHADESYFQGERIKRERRISIITRVKPNLPDEVYFEEYGTLDEEIEEDEDDIALPELPPLTR